MIECWLAGAGWITAQGHGTLSDGKRPPAPTPEPPAIPSGKEIFRRPLGRYGRFDAYTKLGCAAIALALRDARLDDAEEKRPIGIVTSSVRDCFQTDRAYYDTTHEENGAYASPNLFSYTLPGIVAGECAVHFRLSGPTLCVGQRSDAPLGGQALATALRLLAADKADIMLAGWLEAHTPEAPTLEAGALFVVLDKRPAKPRPNAQKLIYRQHAAAWAENKKPIESLLDLCQNPLASSDDIV